MESPQPTQPAPPARASSAAVAAPIVLALFSTLFAVALHYRSAAPGDQPLRLLLVGCAAAFVVGAMRIAPALHVGLAALSGFPLEAMLDLALHGGHNLLPIEFAFYVAYLALGVGAAMLGKVIGLALRLPRARH